MQTLPSYFQEFLSEINPSASYLEDQRTGHRTLRKRLKEDEDFKKYHVNTFLQGSYARDTAIHPGKDVDIVVVTNLDPDKVKVADVYNFMPQVLDRYYEGKWKPQGRSFGISLSYVDLDVVIATSKNFGDEESLVTLSKAQVMNESDVDWKDYPLWIPDRDLNKWVETHPKAQMQATTDQNKASGNYLVPLVKIFKWWRKHTYTTPERPKGYILERMVAENMKMNCSSYPEHIKALFQNLVTNYKAVVDNNQIPFLPDPGNPKHNVAGRVKPEDFKVLYSHIKSALGKIEKACNENDNVKATELWREILGNKFPLATNRSVTATFPKTPVIPNKPAGFA